MACHPNPHVAQLYKRIDDLEAALKLQYDAQTREGSALLNRALAAEAEVERLKAGATTAMVEVITPLHREVERLKRLIEISHQNARMLVSGLDHRNEVRIGYLGAAPDQVIKLHHTVCDEKRGRDCNGVGCDCWCHQ
jgi:hypothetical protein